MWGGVGGWVNKVFTKVKISVFDPFFATSLQNLKNEDLIKRYIFFHQNKLFF